MLNAAKKQASDEGKRLIEEAKSKSSKKKWLP
jgi:hypothetical protein